MDNGNESDDRTPVARRYLVEGIVQGVGFRWHTRHVGQELKLSGWVKNLPDGRVEARACGPAGILRTFEEFLRRGPPASRVSRVLEEPLTPEEAEDLPKHFQVTF